MTIPVAASKMSQTKVADISSIQLIAINIKGGRWHTRSEQAAELRRPAGLREKEHDKEGLAVRK